MLEKGPNAGKTQMICGNPNAETLKPRLLHVSVVALTSLPRGFNGRVEQCEGTGEFTVDSVGIDGLESDTKLGDPDLESSTCKPKLLQEVGVKI